jgi:hypothetical protein
MLISLYYSTCDLDLLVPLSVLPDAINGLSRKSGLSAECVAKFVIESQFLSRSRCCSSWCFVSRFSTVASCMTVIDGITPRIMITWFVICIHAVMLFTTTVMIAGAPKQILAIHCNFVLLLDQTPCCNHVQFFLRSTRSMVGFGSRTLIVLLVLIVCSLCSKQSNLLIKFGLHFDQFGGQCNDLILFTNFMLPSSILKHIVVGFDDFTRNKGCSPIVRIAAKLPVAKNVNFVFETLHFNS